MRHPAQPAAARANGGPLLHGCALSPPPRQSHRPQRRVIQRLPGTGPPAHAVHRPARRRRGNLLRHPVFPRRPRVPGSGLRRPGRQKSPHPGPAPAKQKKHVNSNPTRHASAQPPAGPDGGALCAPEPLSMRLRAHIPVPRTSAREPQKPPPPPSHGNPRKTHGNPRKTQENPRKTHRNPRKTRHPGGTAASSSRCVPGNKPGRNGGARCVRTHRPVPLHTSQARPQDLLGRSQRQPAQIRAPGTHRAPSRSGNG